MVEVTDKNSERQELLTQLLGQRFRHNAAASQQQDRQPAYTPKGREVYDTVDLSNGAKNINLNRGLDIATQVRGDKDPETLQERLKQGSSDISRIGRLFRAVFTSMRSVFFGSSY